MFCRKTVTQNAAAAVQSASTQAQKDSETSKHVDEDGRPSSDVSDEDSDAGRQNHPRSVSPYSTEPQSPMSEGLV